MRRQIVVRIALSVLLVLVAETALAARPVSTARSRTVPCEEIIDLTTFPYLGNNRLESRSRLVLGAVSVPPAFIPQAYPTGKRTWTYFGKWGMVVRGDGRAVTVMVPGPWRDRAAISWGNGGHGVFQSIRFAGCPTGRDVGNAYAGGFYLRSGSACVPLVVRVGERSATVRFGVGRRCR